ncbi:hypothetical protein OsJ_03955 [Oryza sativa Japonica Group]|uniref:Uncharacterized protein n=1 Tax=Oryza sativa subsp. japonica TaxID=39947 RepID=B9EU99_ORYSJ|nr:hypothetical protein OsJ_03955 [Oryza sativa Japonica Group]
MTTCTGVLRHPPTESNEIRDALKDCKLQQMLLKIDGSAEPEKILDIVSPQQ